MFLDILIQLLLIVVISQFSSSEVVNFNVHAITQPFLAQASDKTIRHFPENTSRPYGPEKIDNENVEPEITAKSALVVDVKTGRILFEKESHKTMPIASITKLMTALVFVETAPLNWGDKTVVMSEQDERIGGRLNVLDGEAIGARDLFYSVLVGSANNAAMALVRSTGLDEDSFVKKMNKRASELGMDDTHFIEPTGLSPENVSTAFEVAKLARAAFKNEEIKKATLTEKYVFWAKTPHSVENTNQLIKIFSDIDNYDLIGGKTGYIDEAGFCLVVQASDKGSHKIIAVVLGSKDHWSRFEEIEELVRWTFDNYQWKEY